MRDLRRFSSLLAVPILLWMGTAATGAITPTPTPAPEATATPVAVVRDDFAAYFDGYAGCFVLYDSNADTFYRYNPERCAGRFLPASTFKILNSLIGLETGVIEDAEFVIPWDGTNYLISAWNQDHTLRTAMRDSVVWYHQELARRVGRERMARYVRMADYGNGDISGRIDSFWLDGALRISADEQIDFLRRLYNDELPFSQRSMDIVKDILVREETDSYRLSAKTGSALRAEIITAWYVGYVETTDDVYFFALNMEAPEDDPLIWTARIEIARDILAEMDILPESQGGM